MAASVIAFAALGLHGPLAAVASDPMASGADLQLVQASLGPQKAESLAEQWLAAEQGAEDRQCAASVGNGYCEMSSMTYGTGGPCDGKYCSGLTSLQQCCDVLGAMPACNSAPHVGFIAASSSGGPSACGCCGRFQESSKYMAQFYSVAEETRVDEESQTSGGQESQTGGGQESQTGGGQESQTGGSQESQTSGGQESQTGVGQAVGDPHLQNIHGERFDLMKPGRHTLIRIPRAASASALLLDVSSKVRQVGAMCSDMYFRELNITGAWAESRRAGGFRFSADGAACDGESWKMSLGKVDLKVARGCTSSGARYLNFYVKHLAHVGMTVGGLLGEDDHEDESTPPELCNRMMTLWTARLGGRLGRYSDTGLGGPLGPNGPKKIN